MGCKRPEEGLEITASELPLRVCGRWPVSAVKDKSGPFRRQTGWNRGDISSLNRQIKSCSGTFLFDTGSFPVKNKALKVA